ncbi:MAG: DUF975 family protein [Erysipelotrichaceae bacterium]|nr:DUF975 family protein [Erysipelotrichaceae bacterium]MDY5252112.1 DUF975 family protein [Erysipelotrichaceae bacterium]
MSRKELKKRAKELIRPHMSILSFITLLFLLCNLAIGSESSNIISTICFSLLLSFISIMMDKTTLQIAKGIQPRFKELPNDIVGPAIKVIVFDIIIYGISFIIAFAISMIFAININEQTLINDNSLLSSLVLLTMGVYLLIMVIRMFFLFIPYIAIEEPQLSIIETFKKSFTMVKENLKQLILFELSFLGWLFAIICTCGIAIFYVLPYKAQAETLFYKQIKNGQLI